MWDHWEPPCCELCGKQFDFFKAGVVAVLVRLSVGAMSRLNSHPVQKHIPKLMKVRWGAREGIYHLLSHTITKQIL